MQVIYLLSNFALFQEFCVFYAMTWPSKELKIITLENMAATVHHGRRGLVALIKRGWDEVPEVMASSALAVLGIGMGVYGVNRYYANDGENKRFKESYTVYRPDDSRAAKIKQ